MPTNLPPDYFAIEKRFREAETTEEKIALLEEMMGTIPKHKGTDHLRADLRRKLAKLKSSAQSKKGGTRQDSAFHIEREGVGQVAVVGPTNVGKSALVAALTNATPEVADSPYTTWTPTPGMMQVENVQIQLIDTPPLDREFVEPALLALIRRADVVLLVVDVQTDPMQQLQKSISLLEEHQIAPALREGQYPEEERVTFKPFIVLANKCDDEDCDEDFQIFCALVDEGWLLLAVSARTGRNLAQLKQQTFERLGVMRVYTKAPGREPDLTAPFTMKVGNTVADLARRIHRDFYDNLKAARVWGSAEYDGQLVGRDYVLHDGDIVELRM